MSKAATVVVTNKYQRGLMMNQASNMRRNLVALSSLSMALTLLVLCSLFAMPVQAYCVKLSPSPSNVTLSPGGSASVTITVSTVVNFDYGTETFSATGLPQGVSSAFSPSTMAYSGSGGYYGGGSGGYSGTSTLTLTADKSTPAGTYTVTLHLVGNGPDSGEGNTATITVAVGSVPVPEFPLTTTAVLIATFVAMSFVLIVFKRRK
jgi:hypothetical protein